MMVYTGSRNHLWLMVHTVQIIRLWVGCPLLDMCVLYLQPEDQLHQVEARFRQRRIRVRQSRSASRHLVANINVTMWCTFVTHC